MANPDTDRIVRGKITLPRVSKDSKMPPDVRKLAQRVDRVFIALEGILRKFQSSDSGQLAGVPGETIVEAVGAKALPFFLFDGVASYIPLTAAGEFPFFLFDDTESNIVMATD